MDAGVLDDVVVTAIPRQLFSCHRTCEAGATQRSLSVVLEPKWFQIHGFILQLRSMITGPEKDKIIVTCSDLVLHYKALKCLIKTLRAA